jgi:hypothetical protein
MILRNVQEENGRRRARQMKPARNGQNSFVFCPNFSMFEYPCRGSQIRFRAAVVPVAAHRVHAVGASHFRSPASAAALP